MTAQPSSATAGAASRHNVHVTGPVPPRIQSELRESFDLVDEPAGADGILALLTTTVDGDPRGRRLARHVHGLGTPLLRHRRRPIGRGLHGHVRSPALARHPIGVRRHRRRDAGER